MKILAIDSTSKNLSICISDDNDILSSVNDYRSLKHMENIIGNIDKAFMNLPFGIHDIDLFAVNLGPGDFTGSRIGISVIKTFSMLSEKDAFGFNALDAFAVSSLFKNLKKIERKIASGGRVIITPLMDVRNHEIYFSIYEAVISEGELLQNGVKNIFKEAGNQNVVFVSGANNKKILIKKLYDENILISKNDFGERFYQLLTQIRKLNQCTCSSCGSIFSGKPSAGGTENCLGDTADTGKGKTGISIAGKTGIIDYILTGNAFFSYSSILEELRERSEEIKDIKIFIEKSNKYTKAEYINLLAFFRALTESGNKNIAPFYVRDFIPFGK